jgi:HEAT repeat protein
MPTLRECCQYALLAVVASGVLVSTELAHGASVFLGQERASGQTALQMEIEKQRVRLGSVESEERRDAATRLGSMHHPEASRAALAGLKDPSAIVRATTAAAILSMPAEERAAHLIPLLSDKDEFVRREGAYALGKTRSPTAVTVLVERLLTDKKDEVRGAAAVALGEIANAGAIPALMTVIDTQSVQVPAESRRKNKREQNPFVLRSAVRSLGQIGNRSAVPVLIAVLQNDKAEDDLRRESTVALGIIGDPAALPALREALAASDPYLAQSAHDAISKIHKSRPQ